MSWREIEQQYEALVTAATEDAWRLLMAQPWAVWLYYVPSSGTAWGQLVPVLDETEPPAGAMLATSERIPSHRERTYVRAWIRERSQRLPILPPERESA